MPGPTARLLTATTLLAAAGLTVSTAALGAGPADAALTAVQGYVRDHGLTAAAAAGPAAVVPGATPRAICGPGSLPETSIQGRVPLADFTSGRAEQGYRCNTAPLSSNGKSGGFHTWTYTDAGGRTCAYYDSTTFVGTDIVQKQEVGTVVLDMTDPTKPVETARLVTPTMLSPGETLNVHQGRGLLAAVLGFQAVPGLMEIYDISQDCRAPVLRSASAAGIFGHEAAFSPDGLTFWSSSLQTGTVTAIDVSDPTLPRNVWVSQDEYDIHGLSISADGRRLYSASAGRFNGLQILDVSQVQARRPDPQVTEVSRLTWPEVSIPQMTIPVTIKGRPYLVEVDEYAGDASADALAPVGAARMIDIANEKKPRVVSRMRLEVNQPAPRRGEQRRDPGAELSIQGYAAHYCGVPRQVEPSLVACSFILSGLRVFNIEDPAKPREVAYYNKPSTDLTLPARSGAFAMSRPAFDIKQRAVYYADGNTGFHAVRITNGSWPAALTRTSTTRPPAASTAPAPRTPPTTAPIRSTPGQAAPSAALPATGGTLGAAALALLMTAAALRVIGRRRAPLR